MFPFIAKQAYFDTQKKKAVVVGDETIKDKAKALGLLYEEESLTLSDVLKLPKTK